jgi:hypothetical protein
MSERIKEAVTAALLEEDLHEIYARVFEDQEPRDIETVILLLTDLMTRISRHFAGRARGGDKRSFDQLYFLAANATGLYQRILEDLPDSYKRHAIHHETIPVLVGRSPESLKAAEHLVKLSGVGNRIGLAHKGKRQDSVFRAVAEELVSEILRETSRLANIMSDKPFFLPELSRDEEVLKTWWPHVRSRFNDKYGPHIENHPRFAEYRKSKGDRYAPEGETDSVLRADLRTRVCSKT